MHSKTAISAIIAVTMAASGLAFGQGTGYDRGRGDQQDRRGNEARQADRPGDRGRPNNYGRQDARRGDVNQEFRKGGRLPSEYRNRQYVVDDWRGHNLRAPPRGYHWVQHGSDYVLVAIGTGIILDLLLNHR